MKECADFRSKMIAHVRGELLPLERAHLESHVARCRSCAALEKKCARTFHAVKEFAPRAEPAHLDRLKKRLRPYIADARPVRPSFRPIGGLALAGALGAAMFAVWLTREDPALESAGIAAAASAASGEPAGEVLAAMSTPSIEETLLRRAIGANLHVIAQRDWDGRLLKDEPSDMQLEMQKGFAVMAFKGGKGRKLTVFAPNVEVEVIGTKFFVNVLSNGLTAVGVVSGRVRVHHPGGSELVEAGTSREYGAAQVPMPAQLASTPAIDMDDVFIADHGHDEDADRGHDEEVALADTSELEVEQLIAEVRPAAPAMVGPRASEQAAIEQAAIERAAIEQSSAEEPSVEDVPAPVEVQPEVDGPTVADILAEAERLVASGKVDDAEHLYEGAIAGEDQAIRAHRSLFRYELARLIGFEKNETARARGIFEHLTLTADGEVRTQAAFALCELDLASSPCGAARCLRSIARDGSSSKNVTREADGLVARWKLEQCDHN